MAQVLNLPRSPTITAINCSFSTRLDPTIHRQNLHPTRVSVRRNLERNGRINCIFSDRKQEQAKKALESALGGKKTEFEIWDKEIKKRAEANGGGDGSRGGWFGWGGSGSSGDHFWQEAQQTSFSILGLIFMYLIFAQGEMMLALILNPLLYAMRGPRNAFAHVKSWVLQKVASTKRAKVENIPKEEGHTHTLISAKERVVRKWGSG